jgi:HSP20 family protein
MFGSRWFPLFDSGVDDIHRQIDRMFDRFLGSAAVFGGGYPAINVQEDDERIVASVEIPGIDPAKVNVTVAGDVMTVRGTRETLNEEQSRNARRRERPCGSFTREILLPVQVDADRVEATYEHGILGVVMPKAAQAKPKQIAVQVR